LSAPGKSVAINTRGEKQSSNREGRTAKWFLERTFVGDTRSMGSIMPTNIDGIVAYQAKSPGKSAFHQHYDGDMRVLS
jgi:hypothetical protein